MADGSPQKYKPTRPIDLFEESAQSLCEESAIDEDSSPVSVPLNENRSPVDLEIEAMKKIVEALKNLNREEQERVLRWALSRFAP